MRIFHLLILSAVFLLHSVSAYALDEREQLKKKIIVTESKYHTGKKTQKEQFNKDLWKNKNYVNKWINNDRDYLKLAIEYKKRYLAWAKEQLSEGKDSDIERFIKDENLDPVEQEIVHAMHHELLKPKKKKIKKNDVKKHQLKVAAEKAQAYSVPTGVEELQSAEQQDNGDDTVMLYLIMLGISWTIIIVLLTVILKQRLVRSRDPRRGL